jgi:hypothetical protein
MSLLKSTQAIQYITIVYGILYALFIISGDFGGSYPSLTAEGVGVYSLFILFIIGFSISWKNKIHTGVIFLLWNIGMWIVELFLVEKGGGFGIISGIPLIVLGVMFILKGIERNRVTPMKSDEKWKTALRLLTSIYTILYMLVVVDDISGNLDIDFSSTPGIILIILLLIYCVGFIFAWRQELIAGILFIIWYAGVVYIFTTNYTIGNNGPWAFAAFVVLIQGILYIFYSLQYKTKPIRN